MWIIRWHSKRVASVYVFCAIARNRRSAYIRTQSTSNLPSVQGGQPAQSRLRQFVERKTPWPVRISATTTGTHRPGIDSFSKFPFIADDVCPRIRVRLFRGDAILTAAGFEELVDTASENAIERKLAL